jgi:hypothetical protein
LAERLNIVEEKGHARLIFVGPLIALNFVKSIVHEKDLNLVLVDHFENWKDLNDVNPESFDTALLFDENSKNVKKTAKTLGLPSQKLIPLW